MQLKVNMSKLFIISLLGVFSQGIFADGYYDELHWPAYYNTKNYNIWEGEGDTAFAYWLPDRGAQYVYDEYGPYYNSKPYDYEARSCALANGSGYYLYQTAETKYDESLIDGDVFFESGVEKIEAVIISEPLYSRMATYEVYNFHGTMV